MSLVGMAMQSMEYFTASGPTDDCSAVPATPTIGMPWDDACKTVSFNTL